MKKILAFFIITVLCIAFSVCAFATDKTVYIASSGNDANDGTTYQTAVNTLEQAYELIGNDNGTIVVCNYINLGSNPMFPEHDGTVTITAADDENYYYLGKLSFSGALTLSGDTVFEYIKLAASGTVFIAAGGHNLTMGNNIETTGTIGLLGGYNVLATDDVKAISIENDYTISVASGNYSYIRGGNRRADGKSPFGMISGDVTVNIIGGAFTARDSSANLSAATGMNEHSGNVTMNIAGGTFYGSLFGIGRGGTNNTVQTPKVTGNVAIHVTGGSLNGKRLDEKQDNSVTFEGKYALSITGGSLSMAESISGSDSSELTLSPAIAAGEYTVRSEFTNPLRVGADPWVIYREGYYYMTTVSGSSIYCYKSPTLEGLAYVDGIAIWTAPKGDAVNDTNLYYSKEIWSPELHYIEANEFGEENAGWWLYFSADNGENPNHRLYTVRALTDDGCGQYGSPITGNVNEPVKMVVYNDNEWAIGQSLLRANGNTYLTWTGEKGRGTADFHQTLNIAKLVNPYTVEGEGNVICVSDYPWEMHGYAYNASTGAAYPKVVEGATAVYGDNGEIMIIYSASGYWTNYYCLATLTLKDGADPLVKDNWIKSPEPVFTHQNGIFGPGHAAYTTDAEGNRWMIYHAYLTWERDGRYVFIQPWTLDGTTVDMNGGPYSQDTVFSIYNKISIIDAIKGFGR